MFQAIHAHIWLSEKSQVAHLAPDKLGEPMYFQGPVLESAHGLPFRTGGVKKYSGLN